MRLSEQATEDDVNSAMQLFSASTLRAAKMGDIELEGGAGDGEMTAVTQIEQRIGIGSTVQKRKLVHELVTSGLEESTVLKAVNALVRQGRLMERALGKSLQRRA